MSEIITKEIANPAITKEFLDGLDIEELAENFITLELNTRQRMWAMADLCAYVKQHRESTINEFCECVASKGVELKRSYFYRIAKASEVFEASARMDKLNFSIHALIAEKAETVTDALGLLKEAESNNFTVQQLKEHIEHNQAQTGRITPKIVKAVLNAEMQADWNELQNYYFSDNPQDILTILISEKAKFVRENY